MQIKACLSKKSAIVHLCLLLGVMALLFVLTTLVVQFYIRHTGVQSVGELKMHQFFLMLFSFVIPVLLTAYMAHERPMEWLRLDRLPRGGWVMWVLAACLPLVCSPGINLLSHLNEQIALPAALADIEQWMQDMENANKELTEAFARTGTWGGLLVNLLVLAMLPGAAEELLFRGTIQGMLSGREEEVRTARMHVAIWVTAILFSAIHFQFYGFIPRMLLGAAFGYLLWWSDSLWLPMLCHFMNNAMAAVCYFLEERTSLSTDAFDSFGTGDTLWAGVVSLMLGIGAMVVMRRIASRAQS